MLRCANHPLPSTNQSVAVLRCANYPAPSTSQSVANLRENPKECQHWFPHEPNHDNGLKNQWIPNKPSKQATARWRAVSAANKNGDEANYRCLHAGIRLESFVRVHHSPQCNTVIGSKAGEGRGEVQSSVWSPLQLFLQLLVENWIAALRSVSTDTASFVLSLNSPGIIYYHNEATVKFSVGKL